jgi:exodeoxyribonuclease VII small subunit
MTNNQTDHQSPEQIPDRIGDPQQFEVSLQALEAVVDQLEAGDLSLEESLAAFERGIRLSASCQKALDDAEQRVRILTERTDDAEPEPFVSDRTENTAG